jgi:hypothetical protein
MSDLNSILGLAGMQTISEEQLNEFKFSSEQEKWLGGADRQDPFILARMPGPKPPMDYFKSDEDREIAKRWGDDFWGKKPAPVDDRNPPETATTKAAPDNKNKSEPKPLDKPAVTRAATDNRSKGEMEPLAAEPTATDMDPDMPGNDMNTNPDMRSADDGETMSTAGGPPQTEPTADIDPDAPGEDMNTNPDMTPSTADTIAGFDKQADADAGLSKRSKYDPEIGRFVDYDAQGRPDYDEMYMVGAQDDAAEPETKAADFEADPEIGDKTGEIAARYNIDPNSQQADQLARQELGMDDVAKAKQAANPVASADTQKGTDQNAMRDTMDKLFGRDGESMSTAGGPPQAQSTLKPADELLSPEDEAELSAKYDIDAANRDIADADKEIADLDQEIARLQGAMNQDNGLDVELPQTEPEQDYQQMGPGSVKDMLNKALSKEPKVDMDAQMPSGIQSGEDLYKALDGNLNWLNKNIK